MNIFNSLSTHLTRKYLEEIFQLNNNIWKMSWKYKIVKVQFHDGLH